MFGMSDKEFWEDDPQLYWAYQTFYLKSKEVEIEQINYNAWLQGIYTLSALNQSLSGMFGKKGQKKDIYPKKPIDFNENKIDTKNMSKEEKESNIIQNFNSWARINTIRK